MLSSSMIRTDGIILFPVAASAARPLGLALLDEGLGALDAVLGGAKQRGELALEPDAVGQREPKAADDRLLGVAERDRRLLRDLAGEGLRGGHQLRDGHDALHQADAERFRGRHAHPGQDHLERLAAPHEAGESLRAAAARNDREVDLGQPELRILRGDPDVAGQRELEPAAQREAADGGDDRLRAGLLAVYDEVISYCWHEGLHVSGKLFWAFDALRDEEGASGHFCAFTNSELSVGPTGKLLVCHAIPNSGYGALDAAAAASGMPIPLALQQRTDDRVDECSGCGVEGLCGGGCTAQSVRATGNARGNPGPVFCTLVRGIFRKSVAKLLEQEGSAGDLVDDHQ